MPWLLHLCLPLGTEGVAAHIFRAAHDFRAERILRASVFLSIAFVCVLASLSHAQDPQPSDLLRETVPAPPIELLPGNSGSNAGGRWNEEMESLRERIQALEESVKSAQSASQAIVPGTGKTDSSKSDPSTPKPKDISSTKDKASASNTGKSDDWVDVSSEKWTVKTGGHVQLDYVTWANAPPVIPDTFNYFNFRRLRLTADGTGYGVYDFRLQMTLEPEAITDNPALSVLTPQVKDAYFSLNEIPYLGRFRIGNFFVPFSLEQVTNDTNNAFLERSIPTQTVFAADREVGVALYNCTPEQNVTWTTGFFLDSISEGLKKRLDDNQGYRISGRGTWLPYYDEPSNGRYLVHTGLGVLSTNDQDNIVRFRTRPQVSEGPRLIDTGILLADTFTTGNFETAIVWGRFSVQSEAFLCNIHMLDNTTSTANGAYLYTSWFVTGENRVFERFGQHGAQFFRNAPYSNFAVTRGGISPGALELKARWSHLDFNNVQKGQYNDLTVGFNWYWSDRTRIMFDWIHPVTSETTIYGATTSDLLGMRFDFNW